MAAHDEAIGSSWPYSLRGTMIDTSRLHRTWMLGTLLSFEASAPDDHQQDDSRLRRLYDAAVAAQEPSGAFYPSRVPWVTAQVLTGLSEAGFGSSRVARAATAWLKSLPNSSGDPGAFWENGTGNHISDSMSCSACIAALRKHGLAFDDEVITRGIAVLSVASGLTWESSPEEGALLASAYLLGDSLDWARAHPYLTDLLAWVDRDEFWLAPEEQATVTTTERGRPEAASRDYDALAATGRAFVLYHLSSCIWQLVDNELVAVLEDIDRLTQIPVDESAT
jgi:hypothetical protein